MNPYEKQPMKGIWRKGYAAGLAGAPCEPPYVNLSNHGGTYGARANRIWLLAHWAGRDRREGVIEQLVPLPSDPELAVRTCEWCTGDVLPSDESCDTCGAHIYCCPRH